MKTINFKKLIPVLIAACLAQACVTQDQADSLTPNPAAAGGGIAATPSQALLVANVTTVAFGSVGIGSNISQTLTIINAGAKTAQVDGSVTSDAAFTVTSNLCSSMTLAPSASCVMTLRYAPTTSGIQTANLSLAYRDDGGARSLSVPMTGSGGENPELTFSESPYNYGNVGTGTTALHTFTVSNNTSVRANMGVLSVTGTGYTITAQNCNSIILNPGASCTVTTQLAPSAVTSYPGSLVFAFTNTVGSPFTKTLILGGNGVLPLTSFTFNGFTGVEANDTVAASKTATGVTMKWTTQLLASYYKIHYTWPGGSATTNVIAPAGTASFPISGLTPNTTYVFRINAFDTNSVSDGNIATVSITTPNVVGSNFNGWSDVVATGSVYTDIGAVDNTMGHTGSNRLERNLSAVAGLDSSLINTVSDQITSNVDFATGAKVTYRTDSTAAAPLVNGTDYFVIRVNATTLKLASNFTNANSGIAIDLTTVGTGNMTLMPKGVVKLGWDNSTLTPSGTINSYNVYRSTTAGSGFSLAANVSGNSYVDYHVSDGAKYYYKVHPVVGGVEAASATTTDSEIEVQVPPQNMALLHRWIVNREACTNLIGLTYPGDINRADNYSCAYGWGGGYAPSTAKNKSKWDLEYSMVVDRWPSGCKMKTMGTADPSGGSVGDVYLKQNYTDHINRSPCFIKDASQGWTDEPNVYLTAATRNSMQTNYPGYTSTPASQQNAYESCQERQPAGINDGNGNQALRLLQLHEATLARAVQGVQVNRRDPVVLSKVMDGFNIPVNGSCNSIASWNDGSGNSFLDGITRPHPALYMSDSFSILMNGNNLTRNCYSRYEIGNLWDYIHEWTSTQYDMPAGTGSGRFLASSLNPQDNLLEGFLADGTMGNTSNNFSWGRIFSTGNDPILPIFGVNTISVDATLGSMRPDFSKIDFVSYPNENGSYIYDSELQGVVLGEVNGGAGQRYSYSFAEAAQGRIGYEGRKPVGYRCVGQINP